MAIRQGMTEAWTKSSFSGGNGACVEVASPRACAINVRDSKAPLGPVLTFQPEAWTGFVARVVRRSGGVGDA